jgi:hypothetical protein
MLAAPSRTIMLVAPSTPILRKGGIPRKPAGEVKVRTIDNRRCNDKKLRKEFLASGKALPPELLNIEDASGILGRRRLSDEAMELKRHASARRMRAMADAPSWMTPLDYDGALQLGRECEDLLSRKN